MADLFLGGGATTSLTINWCLLYMLLYPNVQKKVQKELDLVTGRSRAPILADKSSTPYTEAVIHEVLRINSAVPHTVAHFTPNGGTFDNGRYYIPPKTKIFGSMLSVHMNAKDFPNPEKFEPERFINEEGKFVPHPKVIPFGLGKRRCLGILNNYYDILLIGCKIIGQ